MLAMVHVFASSGYPITSEMRQELMFPDDLDHHPFPLDLAEFVKLRGLCLFQNLVEMKLYLV
jgi:hypothetical protein